MWVVVLRGKWCRATPREIPAQFRGQPMSVVRGFGLNGKSIYTNVTRPMQVNLQWVVTPTNGLGITSLKANGYVENVFMHTSTTPTSNGGFLNPNPANGFAVVQLKQNFNKFLGITGQCFSPPSATSTKIDNAALTIGQAYTISTVGNSTTAQWVSVGLPNGIVPAVGVSFIAIATGVSGAPNTSTSRVSIPGVSGVSSIDVVGNPDLNVTNNVASFAGEWVLLQFLGATSSSVTTNIPVAPLAASVVNLSLFFDGSSVTIDGL